MAPRVSGRIVIQSSISSFEGTLPWALMLGAPGVKRLLEDCWSREHVTCCRAEGGRGPSMTSSLTFPYLSAVIWTIQDTSAVTGWGGGAGKHPPPLQEASLCCSIAVIWIKRTDNSWIPSFSCLWLNSVPLQPKAAGPWMSDHPEPRWISCKHKHCRIISKLLMKNVNASAVLTDFLPWGPQCSCYRSAQHTEELSSIIRFYVVKCFN